MRHTDDALQSIDVGKVADLVTGLASTIMGAVGSLFFLVTVMFFFVTAAPGFRPRMAWLGTDQAAGPRCRWPSSSPAPSATWS